MKKLIINFAPTGMVPTKEMTPYVPISTQEIVDNVVQCEKMGVSMVHLHARDTDGLPTYKKEVYSDIILGIREKCPDIVITVSTSGRNYSEFDKRSEVLTIEGDAKPDMASLTLSSLNFAYTVSVNSPQTIIALARMMKERGIKAELEVFDLGMVNFAKYLINKGLVTPPFYFNIILGNVASAQATLLHAGLIIADLPSNSYYSLTGIGINQKLMNALAVVSADGVRVGLEDNIWADECLQRFATNQSNVEFVTGLAKVLERPIATSCDVRMMLQLDGK